MFNYRIFDVLVNPDFEPAIFESNEISEIIDWFKDVHPGFINSYYVLDKNNNKVHIS